MHASMQTRVRSESLFHAGRRLHVRLRYSVPGADERLRHLLGHGRLRDPPAMPATARQNGAFVALSCTRACGRHSAARNYTD